MTRHAALAPAAALLLAACTPMVWVKEDAPEQAAEQALAQCRREAWSEARYLEWRYRAMAPLHVYDRFGRPHYAWPHRALYDPFGRRFMEESRLTDFCMRAKGYHLEPAPQTAQK